MTELQQKEIEYIDMIASMVYQTKLNIDSLDGKVKKLSPSSLRDTTILYLENQKNWLAKFNRGLKKVGLDQLMDKDLKSQDIAYYQICCEFLRQSRDLSGICEIIEAAMNVESLDPILPNIKALLFNHQTKNEHSNEKK